jgi:hypothetical protein
MGRARDRADAVAIDGVNAGNADHRFAEIRGFRNRGRAGYAYGSPASGGGFGVEDFIRRLGRAGDRADAAAIDGLNTGDVDHHRFAEIRGFRNQGGAGYACSTTSDHGHLHRCRRLARGMQTLTVALAIAM